MTQGGGKQRNGSAAGLEPVANLFLGGNPMIRRTVWAVLLAVFLLVGGTAWYLFRPEKAFIDDVVDEPFPGETSPGTAPAPNSHDASQHR